MPKYNKLIRDKIPEIIKNSGKTAIISQLNNEDYYKELRKKLIEEVNEFIESDEIEEIADILEVIESILAIRKVSQSEINNIKDCKQKSRGGFSDKLFLEEVKDNNEF